MTDRLWFKIGEAALRVGATPKELRYWEKVIPELRPRRSKGNLRYYHQEELARLQCIRQWLAEGFTVSDCREMLLGAPLPASPRPLPEPDRSPAEGPAPNALEWALLALRQLHRRLGLAPGTDAMPSAESLQPRPRKRPTRALVRPGAPLPERVEPIPADPGPGPSEEDQVPAPSAPPEPPPIPPDPKPRRQNRKAKPDASVLGRMWSEARLPLDWEE